MPYKVNSDRNVPWNSLPEMPIDKHLYEDAEIYGQLDNAKAALGRLQDRSIVIHDTYTANFNNRSVLIT